MAKVSIGSISTGTLRTEDLLEEFAWELHRLDNDNALPEDVEKLRSSSHDMEEGNDGYGERCLNCGDYEDDLDLLCSEASERIREQAGYILDELFDALNGYCPPFVFFGSHPGDGADFGYWPDVDVLEQAVCDATGVKSMADDEYVLADDGVIVQVSDHGNILVMDMDRKELWSCV